MQYFAAMVFSYVDIHTKGKNTITCYSLVTRYMCLVRYMSKRQIRLISISTTWSDTKIVNLQHISFRLLINDV